MNKNHTHDCTACIFLGATSVAGRRTDLYLHPGGHKMDPGLVARYGNDPDQYIAGGPSAAAGDPSLAVAAVRALAKGLMSSYTLTSAVRRDHDWLKPEENQ